MSEQLLKQLCITFPGSARDKEFISVQPGVSVREVLQSLGLGADYDLVDPSQTDLVFNHSDNLHARIDESHTLAAVAKIDAGQEHV